MDWKDEFAPHILNRGKNYYESGLVGELDISDSLIEATVHGGSTYQVKVLFDESGAIELMSCNCPYALDGNNCKHMAAVLYSYQSGQGRPGANHPSREMADLQVAKLLDSTDHGMLKDFVATIIHKDEGLKDKFLGFVKSRYRHYDLRHFQNQIEMLIDSHKDRSGFINYYSADELDLEACGWLEGEIASLVHLGNYALAVKVVLYFLGRIYDEETKNSDGEFNMFYQSAIAVIEKAVKESDEKTRDELFTIIMEFLARSECDHVEAMIEDLLMECFFQERFKPGLTDYFGTLIKNIEQTPRDTYYYKGYNLEKYVVYWLRLCGDLTHPSIPTQSILAKYDYLPGVRKHLVVDATASLDYHKAIAILKRGLELDRHNRQLLSEQATELKELYHATRNDKEYRAILLQILVEYIPGDLEMFREYKGIFTDQEWPAKRAELFNQMRPGGAKARLYNEEKMYDKLIIEVVSSPGLTSVFEYEGILSKLYPSQLVSKYVREITDQVKSASNRKDYQELTYLLKRTASLPGGEIEVLKIVATWREQYRNKRALMDELAKMKIRGI